jgi:hypothetical protein
MDNQDKLNKLIAENEKWFLIPTFEDNFQRPMGKLTMPDEKIITVDRCKTLVTKIEEKFGHKVEKLVIDMKKWAYDIMSENDIPAYEAMDINIPCTLDKTATYFVKSNCLQIWKDGDPVYENNNGVICKDPVALADSLL